MKALEPKDFALKGAGGDKVAGVRKRALGGGLLPFSVRRKRGGVFFANRGGDGIRTVRVCVCVVRARV